MSLDITLTDVDGIELADMNWLRNPFGLANWLADNTGVDIRTVVNEHAYDDSNNVDRAEFLRRAEEALHAVNALDTAHFWIEVDWAWAHTTTRELMAKGMPHRIAYSCGRIGYRGAYRCIVKAQVEAEAYLSYLPAYERQMWGRLDGTALDYYRKWTGEFWDFARALQDPSTTYYCSN